MRISLKRALVWCVLLSIVLPDVPLHADLASAPTWFDSNAVGTAPDWHYRVPITIPAAATVNSTIKLDVDFNALLTQLGVSGTFDNGSPRVVRSNGVLSNTQEFTDAVYLGATDALNNGRGEVRFLLEDAGPVTYYLYFDITQNGAKVAFPAANSIDGNFEFSATGTQNPPGWTAVTTNAAFDAQVRPSENPNINTDGGTVGNGAAPRVTDGTPNTGSFSYLIGSRTNNEPGSGQPAVTLTRTITVPATNPGTISIRYRVEGWDSSDNNAAPTQYDWLRVQLVGGTTAELVGPQAGTYTTFPFSPNKTTAQAAAGNSGYGQYNGFDTDTGGAHHAGMAIARGTEPWFTITSSLAAFAGQTITLRITSNHTNLYRSWFSIDNVEWSVVAGVLGTPQAYGANIILPNDTSAGAASVYGVSNTLAVRVQVNATPTGAGNPVTADVYNQNGVLVATGIRLFNDSTHGDASANDNIWTNDGSVPADPTYSFIGSDPLGSSWKIRVFAKDGSTSTIGAANGLIHINGQANSPSVQANFYNIDEQVFTLAPSISGVVYNDANHNGTLDGGESWAAGTPVFVNLVQGGAVVRSVTVAAGTGSFNFIGVPSGNYSIVVTNSAVNINPVSPAGWIFVTPLTGTLTVIANNNVANQNLGLFNGSRVSGKVFNDGGAVGGTANNGVEEANEPGIAGVSMIANNGGATQYDSTTTDATGTYNLWIPTGATTVRVVETNPTNYVSTGGAVGNTAGTYNRLVPDYVQFSNTNGTNYSGLLFGDVPPNNFTTDGALQALPGTVVFYPHTFLAGTGGQVTFTTVNTASPPALIFTQVVFQDTNCNGTLDSGEPQLTAATTVTQGQKFCILVKDIVPVNATSGASNRITVTANFTYTNSTPALPVGTYTHTDLTTVGTTSNSELKLVKAVDKSSAKPGDTLTYTVTYTNNSSAPLTSIVINDTTPAYTVFVSAVCGALPSNITACVVNASPPVNGTGNVQWTLTGSLNPQSIGTVTFSVKVQ